MQLCRTLVTIIIGFHLYFILKWSLGFTFGEVDY